MRSLSAVVSMTCLCVLAISLVTAHTISTRMEQLYFFPVFQRMDVLELTEARSAFETGGNKQLANYMERLDLRFGGNHYLLDASGKRVDGGANLANLLPPPPQTHWRGSKDGLLLVEQLSDDGRYWFLAAKPAENWDLEFGRLYVLLIAAILILGAMLSAYIVFPLRRMARLVAEIGVGNLGARIHSRRKDEIGGLARAYDEMAARLERSFTRERQLLQDVSHELRAPLARMNFSVRLARTAPDRETAMDEVKRDLDRLSFLVSELTALSVGPPGGPQPRLKLGELDVETIVADAIRECEPQAEPKHCQIALNACSQPKILGDAEHLRRAVGNILHNAVRHSPDGSTVKVTLDCTAKFILVTIEDSGSGVSPDLLEKIFDPFFQANSSRAADGGLGLGLSIAKRSIEMHGGKVWAENASPGLRVFVKLPQSLEGSSTSIPAARLG